MTGNFQSTQRKDFSVEEHDNLSKKYLSLNIKSPCLLKFDFFNFFKYQRQHLPF